ncbi:MAG: type II secretion system GspH family protein [Sulfuricurvum sp.]|jgi:prepilin-type N-terminal cleavage/methylation domain-containing protein|uniref:type II secretion system protein n=1 Tax=Sulfuricurvum sp. TaxID=2025608 RepID=UPI0025E1D7EA|nr:type II secretion system protein [Sulfuricurvum sp.]MCK9372447.1 type II secretion system GspH family protein [Sulfuricurvum sp.]
MKKAFTLMELLIVLVVIGIAYGVKAYNTDKRMSDVSLKFLLLYDMTMAIKAENDFNDAHNSFFTSSTDPICGAGLCYPDSNGYMYAKGYTGYASYSEKVSLSHESTYAQFSTVSCSDGSDGVRIRMSNIYSIEYNSCLFDKPYWTNSSWVKL